VGPHDVQLALNADKLHAVTVTVICDHIRNFLLKINIRASPGFEPIPAPFVNLIASC